MSTVIRWNPIREMAAMQSAMDRVLDETWRGINQGPKSLVLDVHESDTKYTVIATIPGVHAEDIDINLHENVLTISAEIPAIEAADGARVLLNERFSGTFSRRLNLPREVDADKIEADYENGVLTLNLPKVPEAQPRQIPVRTINSN